MKVVASVRSRSAITVLSDSNTFSMVHLLQGIFDDASLPLLREANTFGLLKQENDNGTYPFAHDIVQKVMYDLIPAFEREQFHLEIGRRMRNTSRRKS